MAFFVSHPSLHTNHNRNTRKLQLYFVEILDNVAFILLKTVMQTQLVKDAQFPSTLKRLSINHQGCHSVSQPPEGLKIRVISCNFQIPAREFLTRLQPSDSEFNQQKNTEAATFAFGQRSAAALVRSLALLPSLFF